MTQIRILCLGYSKLEFGAYLELGICDLGFHEESWYVWFLNILASIIFIASDWISW